MVAAIRHHDLTHLITIGQMGTAVDRATYLCKKHESNPRDLHDDHLDDLKKILADPSP